MLVGGTGVYYTPHETRVDDDDDGTYLMGLMREAGRGQCPKIWPNRKGRLAIGHGWGASEGLSYIVKHAGNRRELCSLQRAAFSMRPPINAVHISPRCVAMALAVLVHLSIGPDVTC